VESRMTLHPERRGIAIHPCPRALGEVGQPEVLRQRLAGPAEHGFQRPEGAAAASVGGAGLRRPSRLQYLPEAEDVVAVLLGGAVLPRVRWGRASGRVSGVVDVRHTLPPVAFRFVVGNLADEPGGGLDLALHVADERAR